MSDNDISESLQLWLLRRGWIVEDLDKRVADLYKQYLQRRRLVYPNMRAEPALPSRNLSTWRKITVKMLNCGMAPEQLIAAAFSLYPPVPYPNQLLSDRVYAESSVQRERDQKDLTLLISLALAKVKREYAYSNDPLKAIATLDDDWLPELQVYVARKFGLYEEAAKYMPAAFRKLRNSTLRSVYQPLLATVGVDVSEEVVM